MLDRRQFLLGVGGGAMLLGVAPLGGCSASRQRSPRLLVRREDWANTICQLCPSGCGLRVRLVNGNPVNIAGNPLHPVNRGGLCARGAANLQLYYDPDRLAGPMVRDQSLIGGWAPVSWQDGLGRTVTRLRKAIANGPGRVAIIRGDAQDITSQLFGRLVRAAGSDWVVDMTSPGQRTMEEVLQQMHGARGRVVYDLAGADFLLSLESGLLESSSSTMNLHRDFAKMRAAGGRFVHAGPRLGVTGSKADDWLPIRPSSGGILALGIAHMLIKEGYVRADFVRDRVSGFDDWRDEADVEHAGIRSWILREFSPQRVGELTDVGSDQIIRIARRFGSSRRPLAIGPLDSPTDFHLFDLFAVHTLNVIVAAIDVPGGVLLARQAPFEALDEPPGASGTGNPADRPSPTSEELARWVLEAKEPRIEVCFVHEADPVLTEAQGDKMAEALRKIPFVVSSSPVLTDTVDTADLVLPGSLWLERRCDSTTVDGNGYPVVSLCPAAARRRSDSLNMADVVLTLAEKVGGRVAEWFPWRTYDQVVRQHTEALFRSGVGDTLSGQHRSTWTQLLERSGWRTPSYRSVGALERRMEERGGWWDPAYYHGEWGRIAPRRGHRVNLGPTRLATTREVLRRPEGPSNGGLFLCVHKELTLATRIGGSLPYLQDLASPLSQAGWVTSAELNPRTAERLEISHGEIVSLKSDRGEVTARVCLSPGIRPDVIAVHCGGGRVHGGRYAAGIGSNPGRLLETDFDVHARRLRWRPTVVRIQRMV